MTNYVPLPDATKPFESEEERAEAFANPRYLTSPEYRDAVVARVSVTQFGAPPTNRIMNGAIRMDGGEPTAHPSLRLDMTGQDIENAQTAEGLRAQIAQIKSKLSEQDRARVARGEAPVTPSSQPYASDRSEELIRDMQHPKYREASPEGEKYRAHIASRLAVTP